MSGLGWCHVAGEYPSVLAVWGVMGGGGAGRDCVGVDGVGVRGMDGGRGKVG